jgi:hypothetical protein
MASSPTSVDSMRESGKDVPLHLYCHLFVAEALFRFLKAQPDLGIVIAGSRYIAAQYADDIDPFLKSAEVVHVLMQSMNVPYLVVPATNTSMWTKANYFQ